MLSTANVLYQFEAIQTQNIRPNNINIKPYRNLNKKFSLIPGQLNRALNHLCLEAPLSSLAIFIYLLYLPDKSKVRTYSRINGPHFQLDRGQLSAVDSSLDNKLNL